MLDGRHENLREDEWCLDSGATTHISSNKDLFRNITPNSGNMVQTASNEVVEAAGIGTVELTVDDKDIALSDVLFVPQLKGNFVSVSRATSMGYAVNFKKSGAIIRVKKGPQVLRANKVNNLYIIPVQREMCLNDSKCVGLDRSASEFYKRHRRLGHLNLHSMKKQSHMVIGMNVKTFPTKLECEVCAKSKIHV